MMPQPVACPAHPATDAVLRGGFMVHIRAIRPEDEGRLLAFLRSLTPGGGSSFGGDRII